MSDLERAQEWLGCERMTDDADVDHCGPHNDLAPDHEWPCPEATRLAALLAETRADELMRMADDFEAHARRQIALPSQGKKARQRARDKQRGHNAGALLTAARALRTRAGDILGSLVPLDQRVEKP